VKVKLALSNLNFELLGDLRPDQEVAGLQLAHGAVLTAEGEELLCNLKAKTKRLSNQFFRKLSIVRK
jgi:hypothetical protein